MLALVFALTCASSLPSGTVVAGVSTIDGTHTDVTAFLPDGTARVLFVEAHAKGLIPKGIAYDDDTFIFAVQHEGADGARVILHDAARRVVVGERAIASQAPRLHLEAGSNRATWIRAAETPARSTFDVVSAPVDGDGGGAEEVLASIEAAWLTRVGDKYVSVTRDGEHRLMKRVGTELVVERSLGKGPLRLPAITARDVVVEVVERAAGQGRARIMIGDRVVHEGIAGMDPIAVGDDVVIGAGTKRAALLILPSSKRLDIDRAGVATPLAAARVNGEIVVVARLDRGRSLPSEVWLVSERGARLLFTGGAVEVYGVIGASGATGGAR